MHVVPTRKGRDPQGSMHRCCMAVVSSCREVLGEVPHRAQPMLPVTIAGGTAGSNPEEGGDDVKSARPLRLGLHTRYNGRYNGLPRGDPERIPSKPVSVGIGGCNSPP